MKVYYDLHIHSVLSPCASDDMTPNNVINMSLLKGLNVIAITDHNCAKNVEAFMRLGEQKGLTIIPGMEVQTKEEVHMLCYFYTLDACLAFQDMWERSLTRIPNRPDYFGNQLILDENDDVVGEYPLLLLTSSAYSVKDVFQLINGIGVAVFAHVDRSSYSVLSNLGFIPSDVPISSLEVSKYISPKDFLTKYPSYSKYRILQSSDAHYLGDIMERENYLELENAVAITIKDILDVLKNVA